MSVPRLWLGALILLAFLGIAGTARADELNVYVVLSCDASANRALLRFGYADDNDPAVFLPLPSGPGEDLSKQPISGIPSREAACRFADGRELKARVVFGAFSVHGAHQSSPWKFSVWLGGRKIIAAQTLAPPDCGEDCSAHSLYFEPGNFRGCDFIHAKDGGLMDLSAHPAPIVCAAPIALTEGVADPIEYPPPGAPAPPRIGAMLISPDNDDHLCRALVLDQSKFAYATGESPDIPNDAPPGGEVVSLRKAGGAFAGYRPVDLPGFHNGQAETAELDFFNDGKTRRVYHVSGDNHYFMGDLFVVTGLDVSEGTVAAMLDHELSPSGDVEAIAGRAKAHGWFALTGAQTPYQRERYTRFFLFRFGGATYLLAQASDLGDPSAVVLKPMPQNQVRTMCVFQTVRPHL